MLIKKQSTIIVRYQLTDSGETNSCCNRHFGRNCSAVVAKSKYVSESGTCVDLASVRCVDTISCNVDRSNVNQLVRVGVLRGPLPSYLVENARLQGAGGAVLHTPVGRRSTEAASRQRRPRWRISV